MRRLRSYDTLTEAIDALEKTSYPDGVWIAKNYSLKCLLDDLRRCRDREQRLRSAVERIRDFANIRQFTNDIMTLEAGLDIMDELQEYEDELQQALDE